jgi:hypothetical protein
VTLEERIAIIPELSADPKVKPEMASLNCGSLNFGYPHRLEEPVKRRKPAKIFVCDCGDLYS